jgi:pimeloyl-ACP methyl ester carboxylesterase
VVGVVLVATSAGGLADLDLGLDLVGRVVHRAAPRAMKLLSRRPGIVERGRRLGGDLEAVLVRRFSYASDVSDELVDFTARMIASTRIEVIGDFLPVFGTHDKREALAALSGVETLVIAGDSDLMIPVEHSDELVRALPHAEQVVVRDAGHNVMLEHPDVVTPHLLALLERAGRAVGQVSRDEGRGPGRAPS